MTDNIKLAALMGCIHSVDRFFQIGSILLGHMVQVNNAVFYKCKINIIDVNTALFGIRKLLQNDSGNLLFQKIVSLGLIVFVQCQIKIIALCRFNSVGDFQNVSEAVYINGLPSFLSLKFFFKGFFDAGFSDNIPGGVVIVSGLF